MMSVLDQSDVHKSRCRALTRRVRFVGLGCLWVQGMRPVHPKRGPFINWCVSHLGVGGRRGGANML